MRRFLVAMLFMAALLGAQQPSYRERMRAESQANSERFKQELDRLRRLVRPEQAGEQMAGFVQRLLGRLNQAEERLAAGYPNLALRDFGPSRNRLLAVGYQVEQQESGHTSLDALQQEWRRLEPLLKEKQQRYRSLNSSSPTALAVALSQAVALQALPYGQSALNYARAADPGSGLLYLGVAQFSLDWAFFCREFTSSKPHPVVDGQKVKAEQQSIEDATLNAYQQPGAATRLHSQFIVLNSTLKELRELLAEGWLFGALDKLLEARLRLTMIQAGSEQPPERPQLTEKSTQWNSRFNASHLDHSIALSYWESAQQILDKTETEAEDLRRAAVLLDELLPLYFRLIEEPSP